MTSFPAFSNQGLKPISLECQAALLKAITPQHKSYADELLKLKPEQFRDPVLAFQEEAKQLPLVYLIDLDKIDVKSTEWKVLACLESLARAESSSPRAASFRMPPTDKIKLILSDHTEVAIPCHTLIFQSDYFCKMLVGKMKENSILEFECKNFSSTACHQVLRYLQLGDSYQYLYRTSDSVHCKWSQMKLETVFDMMLLADRWGLTSLKERCEEWIAKETTFEVAKAPSLLWKLSAKAFPLLGNLIFAVDYLQNVVRLESNQILSKARMVAKSKHMGFLSLPMCQQPGEKPTEEKINAFLSLHERHPDLAFSIKGSFSDIDDSTLPLLKKLSMGEIIATEQAGKCLRYELNKLGITSEVKDLYHTIPKLHIKYPSQLDDETKTKALQLLKEYENFIPIEQ